MWTRITYEDGTYKSIGADEADLDQVFIRCAEVVEERGAFRADQFELLSNFNAHYNHTGPEIWAQSEGSVTAFVDFAGSGGTFGGVSRFLKEQRSDIQCFCVVAWSQRDVQ